MQFIVGASQCSGNAVFSSHAVGWWPPNRHLDMSGLVNYDLYEENDETFWRQGARLSVVFHYLPVNTTKISSMYSHTMMVCLFYNVDISICMKYTNLYVSMLGCYSCMYFIFSLVLIRDSNRRILSYIYRIEFLVARDLIVTNNATASKVSARFVEFIIPNVCESPHPYHSLSSRKRGSLYAPIYSCTPCIFTLFSKDSLLLSVDESYAQRIKRRISDNLNEALWHKVISKGRVQDDEYFSKPISVIISF